MFTLHVHVESGAGVAAEKDVKPVTTVRACVSTFVSETTVDIFKAALYNFQTKITLSKSFKWHTDFIRVNVIYISPTLRPSRLYL